MERLDLSTYAKGIKKAYDDVVSGNNTYAVFTTLKDSSLKPTSEGTGDIKDFVSEFEEGAVQFGVLKVSPYGSDVNKIVLLGWCPDSAPLKSRVSYASNFADVGKVLNYHVDITARDFDDLDVDDIMSTVSKASGARYSIQSLPKPKPTQFKPASKHSSTVPKPSQPATFSKPALKHVTPATKDEWGGEEEIKVRDFQQEPLTELPSAYKPTHVDIDALRSGKPAAPKPASKPAPKVAPTLAPKPEKVAPKPAPAPAPKPVPKPIKPVEPVQPVLKSAPKPVAKPAAPEKPLGSLTINLNGGLNTMPVPKTSKSVLSRYGNKVVSPEYGTKAPTYDEGFHEDKSYKNGALNNFAAKGGLTPAQQWAEKKGKYREVPKTEKPVNSEASEHTSEPSEPKEPVSVKSTTAKFGQINLNEEKPKNERKGSLFDRFNKADTAPAPLPPRSNPEPKQPEPTQPEPTQVPVEQEPEPQPEPVQSEPVQPEPVEPASEPAAQPAAQPAPVAEPESEPTFTGVGEYGYEKDEGNEISFAEGEPITGIKKISTGWWFGTNSKGESGIFPADYVKLTEDNVDKAKAEPEPEPEPTSSKDDDKSISVVAEYDYDARESNELTFKEGDVITDIDKVDKSWWLGSLNGERKLFPVNYVRLQ